MLEEGTDEQLLDCVADMYRPREGEYWCCGEYTVMRIVWVDGDTVIARCAPSVVFGVGTFSPDSRATEEGVPLIISCAAWRARTVAGGYSRIQENRFRFFVVDL